MLHGIERTNRQEGFLVNEKSLLLIFLCVCFCRRTAPADPCQGIVKRTKQDKGDQKIADTVNQIPEKSADNPGNTTTDPTDNKIRNRTEGTKGEAIESADQCPDNRIPLFRKQHRDSPENGPDIQVADPPDAEAVNQTFQQDENVNAVQCFFTKKQRVQDDKEGNKLNIGKTGQCDLRCHHEGSEQGQDDEVFDAQLHYQPTVRVNS